MGASKSNIFTEDQNEMAKLSKALGHPARIAILEFLIRSNSCICGDIVNELGLAQATVSQHLKELKNVGIIKGNIEGASVCYCIDPEKWSYVKRKFEQFLGVENMTNDCC